MGLESETGQGKIQIKLLRFRNIDFTVLQTGVVLFQPFNGKHFLPQRVTTYTRKTGGTITTQPQFKLTDGTNDLLAAGANMNANQGRYKNVVITTDRPATYSAPLKLVIGTAAAGTAPVFKGDIIIEGILV